MNKTALVLLLPLVGALLLAGLLLPAASDLAADETAVSAVTLVDIFPDLNFTQPSVITNRGDGHLIIAEEAGLVWIVKGSGQAASKTIFLDISDRVKGGCERGLLGLAFHPQYKTNGFFYVNYIVDKNAGDVTRISRFEITSDPDVADIGSELILLEVEQPACNHNGGDVHFDPHGMLVTGLGDGGFGGDPLNKAQDPQSLLGKMVRIDVDKTADGKNYAIPGDNPFIGQGPLEEIWMVGLRNPWRFSFDSLTGDLYIGDVGQNAWEEVDFIPDAEAGGQNLGWSLKEGLVDFKPEQDVGPGVLTDPIHVYGHKNDNECYSVIGGHVYRGEQMASYRGVYIYGDHCSGQIYGLFPNRYGRWRNRLLAKGDISLVTFGVDGQGELYSAVRNSGKIYKLEAPQFHTNLPAIMR